MNQLQLIAQAVANLEASGFLSPEAVTPESLVLAIYILGAVASGQKIEVNRADPDHREMLQQIAHAWPRGYPIWQFVQAVDQPLDGMSQPVTSSTADEVGSMMDEPDFEGDDELAV